MPKSRATRSPDSFVRLATATSSIPESFWKPGMCRLRVFLPAPTPVVALPPALGLASAVAPKTDARQTARPPRPAGARAPPFAA